MRESSDRYRAIVETAVDAIVVSDRFGVIQSFNSAAEKIFGYSAAEVIGRNVSMLTPEPIRSQHDQYLADYRKTGKKKVIGIGREVTGQRKDGSVVPLDLSLAGWRDADGQLCFTAVIHDATTRHEHEHALQLATKAAEQARAEAEAANRAKTEFLATMSHEIRTPLTSISGFTDLLSQTGRMSKVQQRYVNLIRCANDALLTVVNDILDFSKVEAGELVLVNRPFSLTRLLNDTVAIVQPIAAKKSLLLKWSVDRNLPEWLLGDDARLRQILLNLLNNAVKFTEQGSVTVSVCPILSRDGQDMIHFSVSDTGIGIPREQQQNLFKQFAQADGSISRRFGGTGLGLAICKRLAVTMGGTIGMISESGVGTTVWFTVLLPAAAVPSLFPEASNAPEQPVAVSRGRILLVDDLETNREIVQAYLKDGGCDVVAAGSGAEAIALLRMEKFDLVLLDIHMPNMDGIATARAIRALHAPMRNVPIVAMTGNVLPQQIQSFIRAGMNDHVGKPIERNKLFRTLWRWLPQSTAGEPPALQESSLYNGAKLAELMGSIGSDKLESTLNSFERQLRDCFRTNLITARSEAHDLINGAGVFGFDSLLAQVRALEATREEDDETLRLLAQCRESRDAVLEVIATTIMPELESARFRKSA